MVMKRWNIFVVFALAVTILGGCGESKQDENSNATNCYAEQFEMSDYQNKTPVPKDNAHKKWIFAGWYKEKGEFWAKFIPDDMLNVDYQVSEGTNALSETSDITFKTFIDDSSYKEVGFRIEREGKVETLVGTQKAKESSHCLIEATLTGIPNESFDAGICVTPYIVTPNGEQVDGVGRYIRVEDSYLDVVNIPVRICSDEEMQSGEMIVNYDVDNFDYVGVDKGGKLTGDFVTETIAAGKIVCRLNEQSMVNGMFANFRFKLKEGVTLPYAEALELFTVTGNEEWNLSYQVYTQIEPIIAIELLENECKWTHNEDTGITGGHGGGTISYYSGSLKIADCWAYAVHEMKFIDGGKVFPSGKTLRMQVRATPDRDGMENLKLRFYNCETAGSLADESLESDTKLIEKQGEWVIIELKLDMFLNDQSQFEGFVIATGGYNDWQSGEMYTFEISNMEVY